MLRYSSVKMYLIITVLLAELLLLLQAPFGFGVPGFSPDASFYMAKILRSQVGDFFVDPFSGTLSIFPTFFHFIWGGINHFLGLDPIILAKLIVGISFMGMFYGFYILCKKILSDTSLAALSTLILGFASYAPTGRYMFMPEAFEFSLSFLFVGMALVYEFVAMDSKKSIQLYGGIVLLSLGAQLWYYNALLAVVFLISSLVHLLIKSDNKMRVVRQAGMGVVMFAIPWIFTLVHILSIQEVLAAYKNDSQVFLGGLNLHSIVEWFQILIDKGNMQFKKYLFPYAPLSFISVVESIRYYLIAIPFGIGLLIFSWRAFLKKGYTQLSRKPEQMLFVSVMLTIVFSIIFLIIADDTARLRRVHFGAMVLLIPYCFLYLKNQLVHMSSRVWLIIILLSSGYLLSNTIYSTKIAVTPGQVVTQSTREVIEFFRTHTLSDSQRVFFTEESLREIAPFTVVNSFVGNRDGTYYLQDNASSQALHSAYQSIVTKKDAEAAITQFHVSYLAFRITRNKSEQELSDYYSEKGETVFSNSDWKIIAPISQ